LSKIEIVTNCNLAAARAWLQKIPAGVDPDGDVTLANWNLSMLERDWAAAEKWLADFPSDEFPDAGPKSFYEAQTALARGDMESARTLFEKVRLALESDVRARISRQMPLEGKRKYADFVIDTSGDKEDTLRQTRAVYDALRRIQS